MIRSTEEEVLYVGARVHYVSFGTPGGEYGQACRCADITELRRRDDGAIDTTVGLTATNPTGYFFHPLDAGGCPLDPGDDTTPASWSCDGRRHAGGTWHPIGHRFS